MDRIGLKVGPFEIVERVRVPEPGAWYLGRASDLSGLAPVLVRFADPGSIDEQAALRRQYAMLGNVDDPRLPQAIAFDEMDSALLVRGGLGATLQDAVAMRGSEGIVLTPATLLGVILEIARALGSLHAAGLVHGHLDPRSVVLEPSGALWVYGVGATSPPSRGQLAPEIARGRIPSPATDQWSLGALALALVVGHPAGTEDPRAAHGDPSRAVEATGRQWPALGRVLGRMVRPDPGERYPDLGAAVADLAELAAVAGAPDLRKLGAQLAAAPAPDPSYPELDSTGSLDSGPALMDARHGGAPTAVPATGADEDDPVLDSIVPAPDRRGAVRLPAEAVERTDPVGWFDPRKTPSPASGRSEPLLPSPQELSLASEPPVSIPRSRDPLIVRLAPVLAGLMVVMLVIWLLVRLW